MANPKQPWEGEDDLVTFTSSGLSCAVTRNAELRSLCGYVAVPDDHPLAYVHPTYFFYPEPITLTGDELQAHGGITFRGRAQYLARSPFGRRKCWALGFDAGHAGDVVPGLPDMARFEDAKYRTVEYMVKQCERLAKQLAAIPPNRPNQIWQKLATRVDAVMQGWVAMEIGRELPLARSCEMWTNRILTT